MEYTKSCLKNKTKMPNQTTQTEKEGQLSTGIRNAQTALVKILSVQSHHTHPFVPRMQIRQLNFSIQLYALF